MAHNILVHAWDALTKRLREVEWIGGALKVHMGSLLSGENQNLNALETISGDGDYETVAVSQTNQVMGAVGAVGDNLGKLICTVTTTTAALVQIKDGAEAAITVVPATVAAAGVIELDLGIRSRSGAWQITTGSGVTVLATGKFS